MSTKFRVLAAVVTSIFFSMFLSLIMTLGSVGLPPNFLVLWGKGWLVGFIVSVPLSYFLPPAVQKLLTRYGVE